MHLCTDSSFSVKLITDSATAIILLHSLLIASVKVIILCDCCTLLQLCFQCRAAGGTVSELN